MVGPSIKDRKFHAFISYAHKDYETVAKAVKWLRSFAKLEVWWDETNLSAGATIESKLPAGIENSRNAIIFISKAAASSGWIKEEYGAILRQRTLFREYSIVTVKIDDTTPPDMLQTTKWVDMPDGELTERNAIEILSGLYAYNSEFLDFKKDIYVSRGWRPKEGPAADAICQTFIKKGFRLVGDSTDQEVWSRDRVSFIMSSCGALLVIAPDRGNGTSKFIIQEIEIAKELNIPYLLVADDVHLINDSLISTAIEKKIFKTEDLLVHESVLLPELIDLTWENFRVPIKPHSFYGSSLIKDGQLNEYVRRLLEVVTGVKCLIGVQLETQQAQKEIIRVISNSLFMLADISDGNYNTLIEAGVARGAGTNLHLVCSGEPRPHRFMFRDMEVNFYQTGVELLGIVHRIAFLYRRRILNGEFKANEWFGN